jgi:hypothetical protein
MQKEIVEQVKARSAWTDADIERRAHILMMEAGVLEVGIYTSKLPEAPEPTKPIGKMYDVGDSGLLIADAEKAREFAESCQKYNYDYGGDGKRYYRDSSTTRPIATTSVEVYDRNQIADYQRLKREWDELKKQDDTNRKEVEEATVSVREAYRTAESEAYSAQSTVAKLGKIKDTFSEYVKLASGNETTAGGFLLKAFTRDDIEDAQDYFGISMIDPLPAMAVEDEAKA